MPKQDLNSLKQSIIKLIDLSSMEDEERTMWKILIPSMNKTELSKIQTVLDQEARVMTDLYLQTIKK